MLGTLKLPMWRGTFYTVYGGPYYECPETAFGVKLAVEINETCDVSLPIKDFSVPTKNDALRGLYAVVEAVLSGQLVYVGCMGGKGRTGLFLSLLAKAWGIENPIQFVRKNYYPHAVETTGQIKFVTDFDIPSDLRWAINVAKFWSLFSFRKNLTTPI